MGSLYNFSPLNDSDRMKSQFRPADNNSPFSLSSPPFSFTFICGFLRGAGWLFLVWFGLGFQVRVSLCSPGAHTVHQAGLHQAVDPPGSGGIKGDIH